MYQLVRLCLSHPVFGWHGDGGPEVGRTTCGRHGRRWRTPSLLPILPASWASSPSCWSSSCMGIAPRAQQLAGDPSCLSEAFILGMVGYVIANMFGA